jgi:PPOX class probable F420-dependent enzyme
MTAAPTATRPPFANLPPADERSYLLPWSWVAARLVSARTYWVATSRPDGRPHAMPVWAVWQDGAVLFDTHPLSRKARNLRRDGRAVVHLASGEEAVILEGAVDPDEELDADAFARYREAYRRKYDAPTDEPFVFRPQIAYAWRNREYRDSVTRFDLG